MPIRRTDIQPPIAQLKSSYQQEQNLSSLLRTKMSLETTPLARLSGVKTEVTYFRQKTESGNNYLMNLNSLNDIEPNAIGFDKIDKFIIVFKSEISQDTETEVGLNVDQSGSAFILPHTIKPLLGDLFFMKVADKVNLYRVSQVNVSSLENDAAFEINFILYEENFEYNTSRVKECVVSTMVFTYQHVGTEFRSVFTSEEFDTIESLKSLYSFLGTTFLRTFYNRTLNTYLMRYMSPDIPDVPFVSGTDQPQTNNNVWIGYEMYDAELVEFMTKHHIFENVKSLISPTKYIQRDRTYFDTVFNGVEKRDYKRIKHAFFLPTAVRHATVGILPALYGKVELMHVPSLVDGCITLYPQNFVFTLKNIPSSVSYRDKSYSSMIEFLVETIAIFVNTKENSSELIERVAYLSTKIENLYEDSNRNEFIFYLYPILGYIIMDIITTLSKDTVVK